MVAILISSYLEHTSIEHWSSVDKTTTRLFVVEHRLSDSYTPRCWSAKYEAAAFPDMRRTSKFNVDRIPFLIILKHGFVDPSL
ncbi:hypothetical protein VNO77_28074 [Canavalia gladiata]|uniref:Uncharacterized protein n=1 Tax=Canavalia gladiata TaxID=3824 RepID=A0AAN9KYE4_CANGL